MLSRTADSLFWMARYVERAETMARLVDMGRRMAAIPGAEGGRRNEWPSVLAAAGVAHGFSARAEQPAAAATQRAAIHFLVLDRENPSSVVSCIEQARANARTARAALTREMWEALNDAWIESRTLGPERLDNGAISPLIDWVKRVSAQLRGATDASALRNDGFEFLRLGLFVERMDASARLLDVKSFAAPRATGEPTFDHYEWVAILVAAGLLRAYHAATRADYEPARIAGFLINDAGCPRSLAFCAERITEHLGRLARLYGESSAAHRAARDLEARIAEVSAEALLEDGLHGFLTEVIVRNNGLCRMIAEDYYFAPPPTAVEAPALEAAAPELARPTAPPRAAARAASVQAASVQAQTQSSAGAAPGALG